MIAAIAIVVTTSLTACVSESADTGDSVPIATPTQSESPRPATEDSSAPAPDTRVVGVPIGLGCAQILSPDALYAFNPSVGTNPDFEPTALARQALEYEGVACGWINQTSGVTLAVAVARFDPESLAIVRERAADRDGSQRVDGSDAFIRVEDGIGVIEAFIDGDWVIIESEGFTTPGDFTELLSIIDSSLQ